MAENRKLVIPVFITHRGCPHQCLFCNQFSITGEGREPGKRRNTTRNTIEEWLARDSSYDEVQVAFYGGSFTCLDNEEQVRLLSEVQPYIASGRVNAIRLSTRPDCLDRENIMLLQDMGVRCVELGVQSLDDNVLRKSRRGHTAENSIRAHGLLRDSGMETGIQLLPGLPGETTRSFRAGIKKVVELCPDMVRLYPAVVVDGSPLAEEYRRGRYRPLSLNKALALTCWAKGMFDAAGIKVIRMGLQHSDKLMQELVAGPYHPAFGELVNSRQWYLQMRKALSGLGDDETLSIHICDRDYSAVVGMKKVNIIRLGNLGFQGRFDIVVEKERNRGTVQYVVSKSS